jgi:hypothetical protein
MKDYFSHDYNSRNDKKLVKAAMKFDLCTAIGAYWCIVEMLYEEGGYLLLSEYERICFELRTSNELITYLIYDSELFKNDGEKFWSETAIDRLKKRAEKSYKARESIEKRWNKYERIKIEKPTKNEGNTSKVKESKVKESKKKKEFIPPTLDQVKLYFKEKGFKESVAIKMFDSYSVADWFDSNNKKVYNWKQKAINVWFKDENKLNGSLYQQQTLAR